MKTILFPVDVGHSVAHVVPILAALATAQDATLHLLHVLDPDDPEHYGDPTLHKDWDDLEAHAHRIVQERLARIRDAVPDAVDIATDVLVERSASHGVLRFAEDVGADLIALPSRIKACDGRRVFGSMARRLLEVPSPPILLFSYRDDDPEARTPAAFRELLVPSDGSAASEVVAKTAAAVARAFGSRIHYLHVVEDGAEGTRDATALRDAFAERAERTFPGIPVDVHVERGKPCDVIPAFAAARDVDLVFMGCHGRDHPSDDFLGENTERVIETIQQPLCVV